MGLPISLNPSSRRREEGRVLGDAGPIETSRLRRFGFAAAPRWKRRSATPALRRPEPDGPSSYAQCRAARRRPLRQARCLTLHHPTLKCQRAQGGSMGGILSFKKNCVNPPRPARRGWPPFPARPPCPTFFEKRLQEGARSLPEWRKISVRLPQMAVFVLEFLEFLFLFGS